LGRSRTGELVFSNDALLAVDLAFDAVLGRVSRFREPANNLKEIAFGMLLTLIWRKVNRLAHRKLVRCHRSSHYYLGLMRVSRGAPDQALAVPDGPQRGG
jgi:hypothetical protein